MGIGITPLDHNITALSFNGATVDGEYAAWSDTASYSVGDRVVRPDHHIYEALEGVGAKAPIGQRRVGKYRICAGESGEHLAVYVDEQDLNRMKCRRVTVSAGGVSLSEEVSFPIGGSNGGRFVAYDSIKKIFAIIYGDSLDGSCRVVSVKITNSLPVVGSVVNLETVYGSPTSIVYNPINGMFLASYSLAASYKVIPVAWDSVAGSLINGTAVSSSGTGDLMFDGGLVWYTYTTSTAINVVLVNVVSFTAVLGSPREISKKGALEAAATYATGTNPMGITIHPSGKFVYTVNQFAKTISLHTRGLNNGVLTFVADQSTGSLADPISCCISPDGAHLYVTCYSAASVIRYTVNQITGALSGPVTYSTGGSTRPYSCFISADGLNVYTCNEGHNTVSKFLRNLTTGNLSALTIVTIGAMVYNGCISPDGLNVYCVNSTQNTLSILARNPPTGALTLTTTIATGAGPWGVCITPDQLNIYCTNFTANTLSIFAINPATGALTGSTTIATGTGPKAVISSIDGLFIYVANRSSNNVYEYSRNKADGSLTYVATYAVGSVPEGIASSLYGDSIYVINRSGNTITKFACDYSQTGIKTAWDSHNSCMLLANAQGQYRGLVLTTSALAVGALTAPTWWTPTIFSSTGYVYDPATYQFISLFADIADSSKGKGFTIAISGTSVSFGAVATYSTVAINPDAVPSFDVLSGRFVFGYQTTSDGLGYIFTGKTSSTSITFTGTPLPPEELLTAVNGIVAWLDLGMTNAYKFIDGKVYSQTSTDYNRGVSTAVDWMQWTDAPGAFEALAIMNLQAGLVEYTIKDSGGSTRLTGTVDVTERYGFVLSSLPITVTATDTITIKITGRAAPEYTALVGEYIIGMAEDIGITQQGLSDRFQDYSEYTINEFGEETTVERESSYTQQMTNIITKAQGPRLDWWFRQRKAKLTVFVPTDEEGWEYIARLGRPTDVQFTHATPTPETSTLTFSVKSVI